LDYLATIGKDKGGVDTEIGLGGMPFGIEYRQGIDFAHRESKLAGLGVKIHGPGFLDVNPAQIDGQLVVDVHPHVVIPLEGEYLTAVVGKRRVDFGSEAEVVIFALVAKTLIVEWKVR
jgi:hypothetical protein